MNVHILSTNVNYLTLLYTKKRLYHIDFQLFIINKIICCDLEGGKLIATNGNDITTLTKEEYDRVKNTIENTDYYDLRHGTKFFLVDDFYKTNYKKTSFSSIRTKKYFWLDDVEGFKESMTAEQIAKLLDGKTWE